jgi:hypothetical protein
MYLGTLIVAICCSRDVVGKLLDRGRYIHADFDTLRVVIKSFFLTYTKMS